MIKNLFSLIASIIFSYLFIFNFNENTIYLFIIYIFFDTIYLIYYEKTNKLKNDLILHHINCKIFCSTRIILNNYFNLPIKFDIFNLQELTTILICFKKITNNTNIIYYINVLLKIFWIPLRIILPLYSIFSNYNNDYKYLNIIYFKIHLICACIFFILNCKWTLQTFKLIKNNNHYSSIILLCPLLIMANNVSFFYQTFFISLLSFLYNSTYNYNILCLDTSMVACYSIYISFQCNCYWLISIFSGLSLLKHKYIHSELHSFITVISINYKLKDNLLLLFFNNLFCLFGFLIRYYYNNTYIWHLSNATTISSILLFLE